jgi:V/A-type H+-transporting ATPase subunit C
MTESEIHDLLALSPAELIEQLPLQPDLLDQMAPQRASHTLERALLHLLMLEFAILLRPLLPKTRRLLINWSRKFELFNLKTLIRGKLNGLDIDTIREDLYDLPAIISLPHEEMLHAENVLEMLRMLEYGPYASIARQSRSVYEEQNEPFSLDAAIDRLYYTNFYRNSRDVGVRDTASLNYLVSTMIDRQNILWLLRYRFAYHFSPSKTYYLLIAEGGKITRPSLMELADLKSFDNLIAALPEPYSSLLKSAVNGMQVRQYLDEHLRLEAIKLTKRSPCAVVAALSYMVARENDLRKVFAIVQGRLLDLDSDSIHEALAIPSSAETGIREAS